MGSQSSNHSRILTESRRDDVAHDALVDLLRIEVRPLHGFAHGDRAQLRRRQIVEAALKFSIGVRHPAIITTSVEPAMVALLQVNDAARFVSDYRCWKARKVVGR